MLEEHLQKASEIATAHYNVKKIEYLLLREKVTAKISEKDRSPSKIYGDPYELFKELLD